MYKKYKEGDASLRECESPWDKDDKCGGVTIVRFVHASGEKRVSVSGTVRSCENRLQIIVRTG